MLFIGTSGFDYPEWRVKPKEPGSGFYPQGLARRLWLTHYARELSACEINATFYRMQTKETFLRWASLAPPGFRFACKAHRAVTHRKSVALEDRREVLEAFLSSVSALEDHLGPVLFQFPPYRERDLDRLDRLLSALPPDRSYAFEFRHESWNDHTVADHIAAAGGTVCLSETAGEVPDELPPGPLAYVRLRAERYPESARDKWRELLAREAESRPVFAFAKHEGIPAGDPYGGVGLAQWLTSEARAPVRKPPATH
jgi:uncharacterized protein YecE (DUF72 family)